MEPGTSGDQPLSARITTLTKIVWDCGILVAQECNGQRYDPKHKSGEEDVVMTVDGKAANTVKVNFK